MSNTWTHEDEATFNAMSERRKAALQGHREELANLLTGSWSFKDVDRPIVEQFVNYLTVRATQLRAILKPFDCSDDQPRPATLDELDAARFRKLAKWGRIFSMSPYNATSCQVGKLTFEHAPHMPPVEPNAIEWVRGVIDQLPTE